MTVPRPVTLLCNLGIFISKRQVVRLLNVGQDQFERSKGIRPALLTIMSMRP